MTFEIETPRVLVVDTETPDTKRLVAFLEENGYKVLWARDGEAAYNIIDSEPINVLISELRLQRIDGMRLLSIARARNPEVCVIAVTKDADVGLATEAMRQGAYDFQVKPVNLEKIKAVIERGISHQQLVGQITDLHTRLDSRYGFENLIGISRGMNDIFEKIRQIAPTRATVLISGETGTGKELIALAIHQNSPRRDERFVKLNCAALSEGVLESELFGHEKGAFTGAISMRRGRFEVADCGTLFIDEVSEITPPVQVKLLRMLQEREFERVGGSDTIKVDVRLVVATNQRLEPLVRKKKFREDLYYRLKVVTIEVPPLRERKEDIPLLVNAFISEFNQLHGKKVKGITRGAMDLFMQHYWPGNVRELRNCIEGMVVFCTRERLLDVADLPAHLRASKKRRQFFRIPVGISMEEVEKIAMEETLKSVGYDKQKAAEILGIGLRTLYRKMKEYDIWSG
ncbi:MAG: sigma-54-dependent Fis family transcriptional regulator [Candidatus Eiseniibacteriota bacterium]|nr:MAG: sigma-54-dependent Fis family transcriptional regulator [Candidatus Eisenbacteria bacterium]